MNQKQKSVLVKAVVIDSENINNFYHLIHKLSIINILMMKIELILRMYRW